MNKREEYLSLIRSNIDQSGYHLTIVNSKTVPRYAYTIGLTNKFDFELIFAGGYRYLKDDVYAIINKIINELEKGVNVERLELSIDDLGSFTLSKIDDSWSRLMLLGVFDFYDKAETLAFQIKPDSNHFTMDVPDMINNRKIEEGTVWYWLSEDWNYKVPENSTVVTNLGALRGEKVTEVMRWGDDEWEMFAGAGPDIPKEEIRVVPLGTLLSIDISLSSALSLKIEKGIWRDPVVLEWNDWG